MQKHHKILSVLFTLSVIFIGSSLAFPSTASYQKPEVEEVEPIKEVVEVPETEILEPEFKLSHAQTVWVHALEWCESRGKPEAVNPVDLDGTPSYGSWQFKPDTFWHFASKYDVAVTKTSDSHLKRENQLAVLTAMIAHKNEIEWHNQFPACVARLGTPPS